MSKDDDLIPDNYTYQWTPKSGMTLQEFLGKVRDVLGTLSCLQTTAALTPTLALQYKPSMVQNDGTKPVCPPSFESLTHIGRHR